MKPLIITAAVAVAAIGGVGAALVAGAWPGSGHPAPLAVIATAAAEGTAAGTDTAAGPATVDGAGAAGTGSPAIATGTDGATGTGTAPAGPTSADPVSAGAAPAGPTTAGTAATDPGTGPAEPTCGLGRWDARVQGAPIGFAGGDRAGDYLWHDATGFHLRVTHRGDRKDVFTGVITSNRKLALRPVRLEGRDAVTLSADRYSIQFRFYDYGHVDGIDFGTDCATRLVVGDLRVDGARLSAGRVYLGQRQAHPAQVPFQLTRPTS